jgi:hypothetical protein
VFVASSRAPFRAAQPGEQTHQGADVLMKRTVLALLAASALLGCHKKTPADKCREFTGAFGKRAIQCLMITQAVWDKYINEQLDCNKVTAVESNLDSCVKDINNNGCDALFQGDTPSPPASCSMLLTIKQ